MTDYKSYALSAVRSKIAYMNLEEVKALWENSDTENTLRYHLFHSVDACPKFYSNDETGAQMYVWKDGKTLHLVFRGTEETRDIMIDLNIVLSYLYPSSNICVHSGFLKQFKSLENYITNEISENLTSIDALHFSGHSLGASLATVASAYYGSIYKNIVKTKCHTVGSPRVGNKNFCEFFSKNVDEEIRIANMKDPVTLIPISYLYSHVPKSICISDKCHAEFKDHDIPWYSRIINLPSCSRASIDCHSCDMYIERLLKLADLESLFSKGVL